MGSPCINVTRLAHVHYQHPDLERALTFLNDFGMIQVDRREDRVFLRGYGVQPFINIAEQSSDDRRHFLGGYWAVDSIKELQKAAAHPNASVIKDLDAPGGGKVVTMKDPNGFTVGFVFGQTLRDNGKGTQVPQLEKSVGTFNGATVKSRLGDFRRFDQGPSPVHKLGHYGFVVPRSKYSETLKFYTETLNLKPTDAVYNPKSGEDETCFCHIDLGKEFSDHHSWFLAAGPEEAPPHVHHSSYEVNDFDTQTLGHDFLRARNWTNCWGIGRHVLGSQIFDYWFDGSGHIVEHYSDGDLVNEDTPLTREPASPKSLHIWGPNIPLAFVTGKIEDVGKLLGAPPDVLEGTAAEFEPRPVVAA